MGQCISSQQNNTDTELSEDSAGAHPFESVKLQSIFKQSKVQLISPSFSTLPKEVREAEGSPSGSQGERFERQNRNFSKLRTLTPMENLEMLFCLSGSRQNTEFLPQSELTEIVTELEKSGAVDDENYLEWENENNETPLEIAIKAGNTVMVGTLLETGNIEMWSDAFRIACRKGNLEIIGLLLKSDAHKSMDVHEKHDCVLTCVKHGYVRLLRKLHMSGFPLTSADKFTTLRPPRGSKAPPLWENRTNGSLLHVAAGNGHHQIVLYLMQQNVDSESVDSLGRMPLHYAVQGGLHCLRSLLQASVDIEAGDNKGHSALFLASSFGNFPAVKLLVKYGADLDTINDAGVSALLAAASSNQDKIVKYLLDEGAIFMGVLPEKLKSYSDPVMEKLVPRKTKAEQITDANYATIETLEEGGNVLPAARIKLHIGINPEIIMSDAVRRGHRHVMKLLTELDSLENAAMQALESSSLKALADIIMSYAFPKRLSQTILIRALSSSIRNILEPDG